MSTSAPGGRRSGPHPVQAVLDRVALHPPPGPAGRAMTSGRLWRSPIRGRWLTSVFGAVLLVALPVLVLTGLLSYIAYGPQYAGNAQPGDVGWAHLPFFAWPASPRWLYRLSQGVHVVGGIVLVPVILAKLWSVIPKFFAWPPARSLTKLLERLSLVALVGGILFEIVTGVMNVQYDYSFGFDFYTAHYWGAWVFIAGFVVHLALKVPLMVRALRTRSLALELRTPRSRTEPEPPEQPHPAEGLAPVDPGPVTTSRRGAFAFVGAGSLLLFGLYAGSTLSDRLRWTALFSQRGRVGSAPGAFPVNKTASAAGITDDQTGDSWRLTVAGPGGEQRSFSRAELAAMPQHTVDLPISCVEGWSTTQTWTGLRLRDLAALVGVDEAGIGVVTSLQQGSPYSRVVLNPGQAHAPNSVLALAVNGAPLSTDHGYPARIVVPALPGVHCTKWVARLDFAGPGEPVPAVSA